MRKFLRGLLAFLLSTRFRMCILLLDGLMASVSMRSHFSMTLICMVPRPVPRSHGTVSVVDPRLANGCPAREQPFTEHIINKPRTGLPEPLDWPYALTPFLFTVVLVGQILTLVGSMRLSERCSPVRVVTFAIATQAIISFASPFLAKSSFWAFFAARLAMGMAEGLVFSPVNALATRWFPPNERASMVALYTSSFQLAYGVTPFITSLICTSELFGGWPGVFNVFAIIGIIWCIVWWLVASNGPESNQFISESEREYLMAEMPKRKKEDRVSPQYLALLTSPVMAAHILGMIAFYFTLGLVSSFLPMYFEERMGLSLQQNGLFTMAPFLAQIVSKNGLAFFLDSMKKSGRLGHTAAAKIAQSLGSFGCALSFISLVLFADCTRPGLALVVMMFCCAFCSCCAVGFYSSMLSLCPPITGIVTAVVVTSGVVSSGVATAIVGVLAEHPRKFEIVFILGASLNALAGVVYLLYGTAELQPWADKPVKSAEDEALAAPDETNIPPLPLQIVIQEASEVLSQE